MNLRCRGIICILLLGLLLSSCGFHLRGYKPNDRNISLSALHIRGMNRYDDIAAELRQLAGARNIKLIPEAEWQISLEDEEIETWQASTTQSLTTSEFYLRLHTTLNIHHKDITYKPIHLMEEAIFQDAVDATSSKNNEKEIIIAELRQKLAENILLQVEHIASNPPDCDCDEPEPDPAQ